MQTSKAQQERIADLQALIRGRKAQIAVCASIPMQNVYRRELARFERELTARSY